MNIVFILAKLFFANKCSKERLALITDRTDGQSVSIVASSSFEDEFFFVEICLEGSMELQRVDWLLNKCSDTGCSLNIVFFF